MLSVRSTLVIFLQRYLVLFNFRDPSPSLNFFSLLFLPCITLGNRRFRITVDMFRERYSATSDRLVKSALVTKVLDILYEACPVGAFIKYKDGRWWNVDDKTAREKVGAYFRDSLADSYKSSAKSKIARRRARDQANKARRASQSTQGSAASSGTLTSAATGNTSKITK